MAERGEPGEGRGAGGTQAGRAPGAAGTGGLDRRAFVKGAVAGAAAGVVGVGGVALLGWATGEREEAVDREVTYHGAQVQIGSPTDMGVPFVPLLVDGEGFVHGRPADLRPFYYCGRGDDWVGARDGYAGDDILRYALPPERAMRLPDDTQRQQTWWFYDRLGERINVKDFDDVPRGEGAMFAWRNVGQHGYGGFYGVLLKIPREEIAAEGEAADALLAAMARQHDLVAFDAACPHFCCISGWHEDPSAKRLGVWDMIFCSCHNARFDPRKINEYTFTLRPEQDPAER